MASHAARTLPDQKCRKTGTSATCWVTPKMIWNRFADHPANSLCARFGPAGLDGRPPVRDKSTGSSIKAGTSKAILAGYHPTGKLSIADRNKNPAATAHAQGRKRTTRDRPRRALSAL